LKNWLHQRTQGLPQKENSLLEDIRQPEEKNRIVVREGGNIRIIPVHEVQYIEAYDDYVKIFTQKEMFLKKKTMSFYEKTLDPNQFVRVHRSYILQLAQLTRIEPMEKESYIALLKSGVKIPLSKTGYSKLKIQLGL
ncbi:MAG TPA: LytTR family DNA-binding domain-containing protein, partial [Chryseosolibacter sp.]|nr:LytTR family DNA-binding domain-containing protein [Chryseosolibacter sp.]